MKKYKQAAVSLAVLTLIAISGLSAVYASPGEVEITMQNLYSRQESEAALEAIEEADYDAWKKLAGKNNPVAKIITREKFKKFTRARALARQGNYNQAIKLTNKLQAEIKQEAELKKII